MKANKCGLLLAILLLAVQAYADSPPPVHLKTDGMALFSMLIFLFALIIYSAHIRKSSRILISLCLLLLGFIFVIYDFPADSLIGLLLIPILGLLAVFLGAFLEPRVKKITARYTENRRHRMIFLTVLALLAIFSVINMIGSVDMSYFHKSMMPNGFTKLTPLRGVTWYNARSQTFTATFMNEAGTPIRIKEVSVNDALSNVTCTEQLLSTCTLSFTYGIPEPTCTEAAPSKDIIVGQGEALRVDAVCATANKKEWDRCDMRITIIYETNKYNATTEHTESGRIVGAAEA